MWTIFYSHMKSSFLKKCLEIILSENLVFEILKRSNWKKSTNFDCAYRVFHLQIFRRIGTKFTPPPSLPPVEGPQRMKIIAVVDISKIEIVLVFEVSISRKNKPGNSKLRSMYNLFYFSYVNDLLSLGKTYPEVGSTVTVHYTLYLPDCTLIGRYIGLVLSSMVLLVLSFIVLQSAVCI